MAGPKKIHSSWGTMFIRSSSIFSGFFWSVSPMRWLTRWT